MVGEAALGPPANARRAGSEIPRTSSNDGPITLAAARASTRTLRSEHALSRSCEAVDPMSRLAKQSPSVSPIGALAQQATPAGPWQDRAPGRDLSNRGGPAHSRSSWACAAVGLPFPCACASPIPLLRSLYEPGVASPTPDIASNDRGLPRQLQRRLRSLAQMRGGGLVRAR